MLEQFLDIELVGEGLAQGEGTLDFVEVGLVGLIGLVDHLQNFGEEVLTVVLDHLGREEELEVLLVFVCFGVMDTSDVGVAVFFGLKVETKPLSADVSGTVWRSTMDIVSI